MMLLRKVMEMDAIKKHLDSKENHHQWYQVKYEVTISATIFIIHAALTKNNDLFSHY